MLNLFHKFLGDALGYNPIFKSSVYTSGLNSGRIVAGDVVHLTATTLFHFGSNKMVNVIRRYKFSIRKVKQTAFFLSMFSKCGIKKQLIYKTEYTPEFVTRFSGFGGWAQ